MKVALVIVILCFFVANGKYIQTQFTAGAFVEPPANTVAVVSYMHIAGAHFNLVFGGFSANTTNSIAQQLLKCHQFRIKALVGGYNSMKSALPLCNDTSCMGYFVWDKPLPSVFPEIAKVVQTVRKLYPELLAYINLDSPSAHPSNLAFDDYIQAYISTVDPDLLSFYNFVDFSNSNSPLQYESNLEVMNRYSRKYSLPFWNFIVSMPLTASSDPTTHQIEWQLYSSLAYNSKGILYYTFWNPYRADLIGDVGKWNGAIMKSDGTKSEHWETARVLNIVLRSWSAYLMRVEYVETIHIHRDDNVENRLAGTPFLNLTSGFEYLLGVFQDTLENRTVVLLNNYDYCNRIWPTIVWDEAEYQIILEVDKTRGILMPVFDASPQVPGFQLSFGAGEGRLFVFVPKNQ